VQRKKGPGQPLGRVKSNSQSFIGVPQFAADGTAKKSEQQMG
jgi:hypothetical protein